jgi:hypothetical protein
MIISHKYKYIFIKPMKVAGSSVQVALMENCNKKDIIKMGGDRVKNFYEGKIPSIAGRFGSHSTPHHIKSLIGKKI